MVFIDRRMTTINKMSMSRMFADTPEELDAMAEKLALDPNWKLQAGTVVEHHLLTSGKRMQAVRYGAVLMSTEGTIDRMKRRHEGETDPVSDGWETVREAFREMSELTVSVESGVAAAGIKVSAETWVHGIRRIVARIARQHDIGRTSLKASPQVSSQPKDASYPSSR